MMVLLVYGDPNSVAVFQNIFARLVLTSIQ